MGLNFHKSVKVNDNTKVNLNKKSASVTVGTKGVHHTVSTSGRHTTTVGIPGTGLSYTMSSGGKSGSKSKKRGSSKSGVNVKVVISAICSVIAAIVIIFGLLKHFGVIGGKSGGMQWRKDEYSVSVGKNVNMILDFDNGEDMSGAKAKDFDIEVDNTDAVEVSFKQAYSETVHFTVTGVEEGAASVKITYDGKTSDAVTVNVE